MRFPLVGVMAIGFTTGCGRIDFDATSRDGVVDAPRGDATDAPDSGPVTYRDVILADSPIAYFRLDSVGTISDETGSVSGTVNGTGNCTTTTGLLTNDSNAAIDFDGFCAIDLGASLLFTGTSPWTMEAWIRWSGTLLTGSFQHVITRQVRSGGPDDGYAIYLRETTPGVTVERVIATATDAPAEQVTPAGTIIYVVATYDGATLSIYKDAVLGDSVPDARSQATFTANAYIAYGPDPADLTVNYFAGVIDEVAVYNRALLPAEITHHFMVGKGL